MKLKLLSDLHCEFGSSFVFTHQSETVLVLAGDIHVSVDALERFILGTIPYFKAVIMVAGNHEYYHTEIQVMNEFLEGLHEKIDNFYFLDQRHIVIDDVLFIGCTGWPSPDIISWYRMSDSQLIKKHGRNLIVKDLETMNKLDLDYIDYALGLRSNFRKTVVVTHFGPHESLCDPICADNVLNDYFWLKDTELLLARADYWLFGHTHFSADAIVEGCRCICNPYGYEGHQLNEKFDIGKVIEL